ncbi:MAG: prenyltransferase [Chloroflexi bacterium]|nr:prenyltransferase [Chloroflexota bacterium]
MGGNETEHPLVAFLRISRPLSLAGGALMVALGAGIADYLGTAINWQVYWLGQAWVTVLQLGAHYLNEYYDQAGDRLNVRRAPFSGGSGAVISPQMIFAAAAVCLAGSASLTALIIRLAQPAPAGYFIMALGFLGAVFYSLPPFRLISSGYGELTTTILVANLLPAFAFVLQRGELHRLLAMCTFPLAGIHLAMMLAFELPDYAADLRNGKRTLMVRLGWQRGMTLHNLLILAAFLLMALAVSFRLPLPIALPFFLLLPVGAMQIWQMRRIAEGAPPRWNALTMTAAALYAAAVYLLAYAFWTR